MNRYLCLLYTTLSYLEWEYISQPNFFFFFLERANFLMITGIWAWPQFSSSKPAIKNVARSTPKQTPSYHMIYSKALDVSFYFYSAWVFIFSLCFKALDDSRHPYTCQVKPKLEWNNVGLSAHWLSAHSYYMCICCPLCERLVCYISTFLSVQFKEGSKQSQKTPLYIIHVCRTLIL